MKKASIIQTRVQGTRVGNVHDFREGEDWSSSKEQEIFPATQDVLDKSMNRLNSGDFNSTEVLLKWKNS